MAHHQRNQQDTGRRTSALQSLLKMFTLKSTPTTAPTEDEVTGEADEPPDDQISPLQSDFPKTHSTYTKTRPAMNERRESLLTQAIVASGIDDHPAPSSSRLPRGTYTASSYSTASMASTAELTSDGGLTSSSRSASPSPPLPPSQYAHLPTPKMDLLQPTNVAIAPVTKHDEVAVVDVGEAAVEKALGRKRCIGFACGNAPAKPKDDAPTPKAEPTTPVEPPKRKCMISFACPKPSKQNVDLSAELARTESKSRLKPRSGSPAPGQKQQMEPAQADQVDIPVSATSGNTEDPTSPVSPQSFHEFASSQDEPDAWVDRPIDDKHKLTLNDCMKKENAIRKMGEEAEQEAEQEEEEAEEREEEEADDVGHEDDFAPSDDSSNGGNESDDEDGFAQSDDEESDAGSEGLFWAPSTTTTVTGTENIDIHHNISHFSSRQRATASSPESSTSPSPCSAGHDNRKSSSRRRAHRLARLRPGTPELPDSTDFVCGTLDEDRPLEAAYISCREQKKLEKHVPIPQDIDPSFPTTDPEDNDDDDDNEVEVDDTDDHLWFKDQLVGVDNERIRGRQKNSIIKREVGHGSSPNAPTTQAAAAAAAKLVSRRSPPPRPKVHRSPPPKARTARSPPPRRLFGHSPTTLRSPGAPMRLRSPRGSPTARPYPVGVTVNRLAQRPHMGRTASLPHTPNPFFRNYNSKSETVSTVTSGAVTPADSAATPRAEMHVRGPVDIVIGLEKKRQKRKEKFWRLHCRKAAKEQAEKKPVPGRGAERMKELGLECAERNRGYGLGQTAQLVISL